MSDRPTPTRKIARQATSAVARIGLPPQPNDPLLAFTPVPHKAARRNSITAGRQRAFIAHLAATGIVTQAAMHIGASMEALYKLRNRPGAEEFSAGSLRAGQPVVTTDAGGLDLLAGLIVSAADKVALGQLPDAPVCLVAGPAGRDAAVRKVARVGDGMLRPLQPGQALAVGAAGESFADLAGRLGGQAALSLCDLSDARVRFSLSGPQAVEIIATQSAIDTHPKLFKAGASAPTRRWKDSTAWE